MNHQTLAAMACSLLLASAPVTASEPHGDMAGHEHIALFVGAGQEQDKSAHTHGAKAVGLEFEYRLDNTWGIGGVVERLDVHGKTNTVLVIPVSYHFGGGFRAFAGPGYEFKATASKDKALFRVGFGYEFHVNENWTVAPEVLNDFLDGGNDTWLLGVAIGYGFH